MEDLDLDLDEFEQKFNGDVIGKVINIASRCSGFLNKLFSNTLGELNQEGEQLINNCLSYKDEIATCYEQKDYAMAARSIMSTADQINQYINHHQPWKIAKQLTENPDLSQQLHGILSTCIHSFYILIIYLQPILPELAKKSQYYLNIDALSWHKLQHPLFPVGHQTNTFSPLSQRLQKEDITKMLNAEKAN